MITRKFYCGVLVLCGISCLQTTYAQTAVANEQSTKKPVAESASTTAQSTEGEEQPPPIGNFALPLSQQPIPLFGFGETVVDKGVLQVFYSTQYARGENILIAEAVPNILYGLRDDLAISFDLPVAIELKNDDDTSSGLEDIFFQIEYAFYQRSTNDHTDQLTVVGNVTAPTGSSEANPPTGLGSPSYYLGTTLNRTGIDWIVIGALGSLLPTTHDATQPGNQYFYQAGVGRNIFAVPEKWLSTWMVEFNGRYIEKNTVQGVSDPNSGGNIIYLTPSFWLASAEFILQTGAGVPINQELNGDQEKTDYIILFNIAWTMAH